MHDPPTVDARQLGGSVQRGRGEQAVARKREKGSSPRPRIVFNSPGRTVNVLGSAGVREFLVAKGIGEEEVAYFSEGVKNGGILVLVEAQDDQKPFVLDIMQEELAVTETMDGQAG
jgi:hypothetical protein